MEKPKIKVSSDRGITVVALLDEEILNKTAIDDITKSLFSLVGDKPPVRVLLSFAAVKRLSSDMLGTLLRLTKRINENHGDLKLCSIIPPLYEMFAITKVNQIFDIYHDEETALNSFSCRT
ncbi:STAS domain-containing protein [Planctomycetota bacterium]